MFAFVIVILRLELVKKKSRRQCISGFLLLRVNLLACGLRIRQIPTRPNKLAMYKTSFSEFLTKPLGTGLIGPLNQGFVISKNKLKD